MRTMLEIKGKINTAICYASVIEDEAIEQIRRMCDYEFTEGSRICIMQSTLDEAPMAYKSLEDIIDVIRDSVDIIDVMKPIYNFKASD